ncbi:MAG TPA: DMT family transporter [Acidobacteriaceae bacterium]|nr:DMT family transporter [Acidobacteriaceae bacterium]
MKDFAGVGLALLAAVSWGGGDFSGGMGVKSTGGSTRGALRIIVTAHAVSLAVLGLILGRRMAFPFHDPSALWGLGCGVVAGLSLSAFYIALARGTMGVSAAISGLLAAAIPAAVGTVLEGRPSPVQLAGFALAALAIWWIAAPVAGAPPEPPGVMRLAIGGGIGFGLYFAGLKFANPLGILVPMALARTGSLATCLLLLALLRGKPASGATWLNRAGWLWACGVALLDTGGNLLYIAATRAGRLDVAAVLASLYPASTILLAAGLLHERPGRRQLLGMGMAVAAVVLVTI